MWVKWQARLRRVPLFGPLVDCTFENHFDTSAQIAVILVLSTLPLWLGALVVFSTAGQQDLNFKDACMSTISHGELFVFGTALLAPIFWIALVDPPGARRFPSKLAHMVLTGVMYAIGAVYFGLGSAGVHLKQPFTLVLSEVVFWTSLALLYLGTLYHTSRLPDAPQAFREDETDFAKEYREHRQ